MTERAFECAGKAAFAVAAGVFLILATPIWVAGWAAYRMGWIK